MREYYNFIIVLLIALVIPFTLACAVFGCGIETITHYNSNEIIIYPGESYGGHMMF